MRTSVLEVRDMLSILSVLGAEERIGKVPRVESAAVNFTAGSATVRYDETRLMVADIGSAVRQIGYRSEGKSVLEHASEHGPARLPAAVLASQAAPSEPVQPCPELVQADPRSPLGC